MGFGNSQIWKRNKKGRIFVWDANQKCFFYSWEKDIIFGGHPKQIFGPSYFNRALVVEQPFIAALVRVGFPSKLYESQKRFAQLLVTKGVKNCLRYIWRELTYFYYLCMYIVCSWGCHFCVSTTQRLECIVSHLKFIYSEKATKFCEIFTLLLTGTT